MTRAGRRRELLAGAGFALTVAGALTAAAAASRWGVLVWLAVAVVVEARAREALARATALVGAGSVARAAATLLMCVLLAARIGERSVIVATGVTAGLLVALAAVGEAARTAVTYLRRPPLLSRNLDLGDVAVPHEPPSAVETLRALAAAPATLVALGLVIDDGDYGPWFEAAMVLAAIAALVPASVLGVHAWRLWRMGVRARVVDDVLQAVERLNPEVVLYFGATPEETYQVEMWLEPVERTGRPALVVLRDHEALARLGPTSLPVVCTPYNGTIARLPLRPAVVTMFVTHAGNNVAMLRRREVRSVFVGHGDSDKPDSANAYARVYDEVWVAGPLGRRRYAEAAVGVRPEAIVEVGRPQLMPPVTRPPVPTVLYAPTWEGWGDDPHHTSLPHVGPALVRALVARGDVRVLYRPHPLTGLRTPAVRQAHAGVVALLRDAGAVETPYDAPSVAGHSDLLDDAVATGRRLLDREDERRSRVRADARFWSAAPATAHRILDPRGPGLASCFDQASVLVADVSSVVSDFLVSDRAYGIVDTRGLGAEELRRRFPAARGGFVLAADLADLGALCEVATGARPDPTAAARRALTADALGEPGAADERFTAAVGALLARA